MNKFWNKIKAIKYLLFSDGYILIYENRKQEEVVDAGFWLNGLDEYAVMEYCDVLADSMEDDIRDEEEQIMATRVGQGMINFVNLN